MKFLVLFSCFTILGCSQPKEEAVKAKTVQAADSDSSHSKSNSKDAAVDDASKDEDNSAAEDSDKAADGKSSDSLKDKVGDAAVLAAEKAKQLGSAFDLLKSAAAANLSCESSSDCSVVEYGSKACGGPEGYLVLSKKNVQVASGIVSTLNMAYTTLSATIQAQNGTVSNCALELPSSVACVSKVCVKK